MAMTEALAEVLVCGAGPVGLSCAYMLASAGMDVMVVDAADTVDASPRAAFHHGPTVVALEALGLLEDLRGVAYTGGQMGRHTPEYDYLRKIDFDGMMVGQDAICNVLMDRLRAMPNRRDRDRRLARIKVSRGQFQQRLVVRTACDRANRCHCPPPLHIPCGCRNHAVGAIGEHGPLLHQEVLKSPSSH